MKRRLAVPVAFLIAASFAGAQGHALRFTKDHQSVVIPDCPALHITGDLTIEAWIKPEENRDQKIFKFILSKNYGGRGYALVMVGRGAEERLQFETNMPLAYGVNEGYSEKAFRNTWIHVAGVEEGGKMRLYINGLLVKENPKPTPIFETDMPLQIGGSPWNGFHGSIDEVRIWNIARTQEEINRDKGRYLTGKEPGLVGYWTFDEGKGRIAHNKTGLTPDGVLGYDFSGNPKTAAFVRSGETTNRLLPQWAEGVRLTWSRKPHKSAKRHR